MSTFREASKGDWTAEKNVEHINAGSLQRIADAAELMAKNHDALLRAKKSAKDSRDYWQAQYHRMERCRRSLRGYITRLKRGSSLPTQKQVADWPFGKRAKRRASRPSHGGKET